MPTVHLQDGVDLFYEEGGGGAPILLLHAGWGRRTDPFAPQLPVLEARGYRWLWPDRLGYGRSTPAERFPWDFHRRAAQRQLAFLTALGIERAALWGHSDGAVIALWMALLAPERIAAVVFEGGHLWKKKPRSLRYFRRALRAPETFPPRALQVLQEDHGERWRQVLALWAGAWIDLFGREGDLYDGRLGQVPCPVLVLHGDRDPHTGIAEVEELARRLPQGELWIAEGAGHAPHADPATREGVARWVPSWLAEVGYNGAP